MDMRHFKGLHLHNCNTHPLKITYFSSVLNAESKIPHCMQTFWVPLHTAKI